MSFDRKYLAWALSYAAIGICLGIFMAASHNYAQREAHSHTLLVSFVLSLGYGVIHKLWIEQPKPIIANPVHCSSGRCRFHVPWPVSALRKYCVCRTA